ncbi:MAG: radical SAM protein, partial [Verrucomicrobiota bacterium]
MTGLLDQPPAAAELPTDGDSFQQVFLGVLVIQPSPFCNLDCDYCYLPNRMSKTRMEMSTLRKVMERVWESGLVADGFQLLWHAGEPLAVPVHWYEEAFDVINSFPGARQRILHTFQTNATLINDKWCEFIKKHRVEVGVSIDGPAFIHDHHRKTRSGRGTHDKVMRGVAKLL